jgi:quercetin dioxygenase-like cupin family protein
MKLTSEHRGGALRRSGDSADQSRCREPSGTEKHQVQKNLASVIIRITLLSLLLLVRLGSPDLRMPQLIVAPTRITAAGNKPKQIEEFIGRVNSRQEALSVARMKSPAGWVEPGQRPEFEEISIVLGGSLRVEYEGGHFDVTAGQAVICQPDEWVRYSTPEGAEYIAICLPAFSPDTVHRDA